MLATQYPPEQQSELPEHATGTYGLPFGAYGFDDEAHPGSVQVVPPELEPEPLLLPEEDPELLPLPDPLLPPELLPRPATPHCDAHFWREHVSISLNVALSAALTPTKHALVHAVEAPPCSMKFPP